MKQEAHRLKTMGSSLEKVKKGADRPENRRTGDGPDDGGRGAGSRLSAALSSGQFIWRFCILWIMNIWDFSWLRF